MIDFWNLKVWWPCATVFAFIFLSLFTLHTFISIITFAEAHLHNFTAAGSVGIEQPPRGAEPRFELGPALPSNSRIVGPHSKNCKASWSYYSGRSHPGGGGGVRVRAAAGDCADGGRGAPARCAQARRRGGGGDGLGRHCPQHHRQPSGGTVILITVLRNRIRIRIHRVHVFLGLLISDSDLLVRGLDPDPDPSIKKQK